MLKLYNTLTRQIEEVVKPEGRKFNMYTCGPTIYNYAHIGNLRSFILADLLYRTLEFDGYSPMWVMNLTDIDDKTIKGTIEKFGKNATVDDLRNFTEEYYQAFLDDLYQVNVLANKIKFIRVTDKMSDIQQFIVELINKGYAYKAEDGSTYFSIEKYQQDFGDYGQLVGEKFIEGKKIGARVAVDEYEKDNLSDFALWKSHHPETDGNIYWDHSTLGKGRPGWHIECSVINKVAFNGEPVDIHTGGVDLIFPHHTNEIAQSQALLGKGNFVKHWFHSEHLLVDGKKMSKSLGNFYTLKDLELLLQKEGENFENILGYGLRYLFQQSSFNKQQNFTHESFAASLRSLHNLHNQSYNYLDSSNNSNEEVDINNFGEALRNNLNVPQALGYLHQLIDRVDDKRKWFYELDSVLGLALGIGGMPPPPDYSKESLPEKVQQLVAERQAARDMKDFQKSDELRLKIRALGYEVKDTAEGQDIEKK